MDGRPPTTDHRPRMADGKPRAAWADMAGIYVVLIRGINVGRAKRVAMADPRELVRGFGYVDVKTVLNSSNVVFTTTGRAADPGALIEKAMGDGLGVSARVITVKASELDSHSQNAFYRGQRTCGCRRR